MEKQGKTGCLKAKRKREKMQNNKHNRKLTILGISTKEKQRNREKGNLKREGKKNKRRKSRRRLK
jgi:hypothetical protein